MGNVDLKRLAIMIAGLTFLAAGYMYFSSERTSPKPPLAPPPATNVSPAPAPGTAGQPPGPQGSGQGSPVARSDAPPVAEPAREPETESKPPNPAPPVSVSGSAGGVSLSGSDTPTPNLPDPFMGTTAELVKLKKEAEILESKIKILDLKAKQAEAELKEKRARALANMIEKNPRILLSLASDSQDPSGTGGLPSPQRLPQGLPGSDLDDVEEGFKKLAQTRSPTVKMVMLGREKKVTVEFGGKTYTLTVGDKVQDMEVVNVTPRGAILKLSGKQEFIPVNEALSVQQEEDREKKSENRSGNPKR